MGGNAISTWEILYPLKIRAQDIGPLKDRDLIIRLQKAPPHTHLTATFTRFIMTMNNNCKSHFIDIHKLRQQTQNSQNDIEGKEQSGETNSMFAP